MAAYPVSSFIELMNTPKKFLRSVSNMLQEEHKYSTQLNSLMRSRVLSLSTVSVFSQDEAVRDEAFWTLANLIGADDAALREFAIQHVREHNIAAAAARSYRNDSGVTAKSAAYFLCNWARYIDNAADAKRFVMDLLPIALVRRKGALDLLWAAVRVANRFPETIPVHVLTTALRNDSLKPKRVSLIWRLIGRAAEERGLVDGCIDTLMLRLEAHLPRANTPARKSELLWILSNLLNEERGVGIFHYKYYRLRKIVEEIAWTCVNQNGVLHEALMVLANYTVLSKEKEVRRYLANDDSLRLLFRTFARANTTDRIRQVAKEGLAGIEQCIAEHQQEPEEVIYIVEDDDDATISEVGPNDDDDCFRCLLDTGSAAFCPTAYDLLAGDFRGRESKAVRDLVDLLSNKPAGTWASIPPDYQLTVADLMNLQHMGYVIQNGRFGINPSLYSE